MLLFILMLFLKIELVCMNWTINAKCPVDRFTIPCS